MPEHSPARAAGIGLPDFQILPKVVTNGRATTPLRFVLHFDWARQGAGKQRSYPHLQTSDRFQVTAGVERRMKIGREEEKMSEVGEAEGGDRQLRLVGFQNHIALVQADWCAYGPLGCVRENSDEQNVTS